MDAKLKSLNKKRESIKSKLTRFSNFLVDLTDASKLSELYVRLEKVELLWDEFDTVQSEIEFTDETNDHTQDRIDFETSYFESVTRARDLVKTFSIKLVGANTPSTNTTNTVNSDPGVQYNSTNLPKLNLPEFHGTYEKWLQFADTYKAMIHNCSSISQIQKFWYLKSCLKGEAANVLTALEVSEANYSKAWDLLCERYENKRVIIQSHLKAIFDIQGIQKESYIQLRNIIDTVNQHLRNLESLCLPVSQWDTIIIYLVSSKIDSATKREWEEYALKLKTVLPTFKEFTNFLNQRCQLLEGLYSNIKGTHSSQKYLSKKTSDNSASYVATTGPSCIFCHKDHYIFSCSDFLKLNSQQRLAEIRKLKACINCLRTNHQLRECKNPYVCKKCSNKHNTLLHIEKGQHRNNTLAPNPNDISVQNHSDIVSHVSESTSSACISRNNNSDPYILLSTANVLIIDTYGKPHKCRAILDNCSQSNFITQKLFNILQLPVSKVTHSVEGFGSNLTSVLQKTIATIKSTTSSYVGRDITFLISNKIMKDLPAFSFDISHLNIPENIVLADKHFNETGPIDMLIGASVFWELMCIGRINLIKNHTVLQKTQLGWILSGPLPFSQSNSLNTTCNLAKYNNDIHALLERFWKLEECQSLVEYSQEEADCEAHFMKTTTRDESGRFVVSLPVKENISQLGNSYETALKRFYAVEKKFNKNPGFKQQYISFMFEYEALGHMTKVDVSTDNPQDIIYYLLHHGVVKTSSTTTKLRVVFDGSAKTSSGISLNDILKVGPTIQDDLFTIVTRFRTYEYVVTGDIEKMYRMVGLEASQRDLQRIVWRADPSKKT